MSRRLAFPLIALAACAPDPEPLGAARGEVRGGTSDDTDTTVVLIWTSQLEEYCTGSLLAPNLVLTAAHCVSTTATSGQTCASFVFDGQVAPTKLLVSDAAIAPKYTTDYQIAGEVIPLPAPGDGVCGQDLALVVLGESLPASAAPLLVPRIDAPPVNGEVFSAIGYGETTTGTGIGERRRLDGMSVFCTEGCGLPYAKEPEWVAHSADPHTGPRPGDSGSPAIDAQGRVIGVLNRHAEAPPTVNESDRFVYGSVSATADWLRQGAVHAAEVGGYAPPSWALGWPTDPAFSGPVGGACDASCATTLCAETICSRRCNDASPCPAGFTCRDVAGTDLCALPLPEPEPEPDPTPQPTPEPTPTPTTGMSESETGGCNVGARGTGAGSDVMLGLGLALALSRRRRRGPQHRG